LSTTYSATVTFSGSTIVITQQLVVFVSVRTLLTSESWNAIDKTITDTYTLAVTETGTLTSSVSTASTDHSDPTPTTNAFVNAFTEINQLSSNIAAWLQSFVATSFRTLPIDVAQIFVFPGGNTFAFKDVVFSQNQDLVSHISYAQIGQ